MIFSIYARGTIQKKKEHSETLSNIEEIKWNVIIED